MRRNRNCCFLKVIPYAFIDLWTFIDKDSFTIFFLLLLYQIMQFFQQLLAEASARLSITFAFDLWKVEEKFFPLFPSFFFYLYFFIFLFSFLALNAFKINLKEDFLNLNSSFKILICKSLVNNSFISNNIFIWLDEKHGLFSYINLGSCSIITVFNKNKKLKWFKYFFIYFYIG